MHSQTDKIAIYSHFGLLYGAASFGKSLTPVGSFWSALWDPFGRAGTPAAALGHHLDLIENIHKHPAF